VLGLLASALSPAASALASDGSYIVVLKDKKVAPSEQAARNGVKPRHVFGSALKGYSAPLSRGLLKRLERDPKVAYVIPDRPVRASGKSGGGATSTQQLASGVDRIDGDLSGALSGNGAGIVPGPAVAVLDTGSGPHPELNVAGGVACQGTTYEDRNGHGTWVAGVVGAKDDSAGVVGIVPGAPIYSVRVLDSSGNGYASDLICGIDWVTANAQALKIRVANLSLSLAGTDDGNCGYTNNDPVHQAICASIAKNVTYVVAAGNSTHDLAQEVPAAYDDVLTVTALSDTNGRPGGGGSMPKGCTADGDDTSADFSNFAAPGTSDVNHTIAAPGKCINSTWKGGGYQLMSGTSMAAPHAAGAAALCISTGPCSGLSPAGIITKLRTDAAAQPASYGFKDDPRTPIAGRYYGYLLYVGGYKGLPTG
jgi:subtilisin family serine protease